MQSPELEMTGLETQTILLDPQSQSKTRCVFRIEAGNKFLAKRLRICNFGLSNTKGDQVYFNHNGIYSLVSRIGVSNLNGTTIDELSNMDIMGIRLTKMPNSSEFSINRQLSQQMCNSIFVQSFSQTALTEKQGADDSSLMGNSIYIDVSAMLTYLASRTVIDEGLTIYIEWVDPSVLGYDYEFTRPPVLAYDLVLDPRVQADVGPEFGYTSIISDRILMQGSPSFDRRLQSYFMQYIKNFYIYNIGRQSNKLRLPLSRPNEVIQLQIDGKKVLTLKGLDSDAKKLFYLTEYSGKSAITHYASYADGVDSIEGLYNPNLGIHYSLETPQQSAVFSYGCIRLDRQIGSDFTLSYQSDLAQGTNGVVDGDTVVTLAEVVRAYDKRTGLVRFVSA